MKFSMLPQPVGLLKLMQNLFHRTSMRGGDFRLQDSVKHTLNITTVTVKCLSFLSSLLSYVSFAFSLPALSP